MDVHAQEEDAFRMACETGKLAVVRELLSLTGDRRVDVHAENEAAFRLACETGKLAVVRELLSLTGDSRICPLGEMFTVGVRVLASGLGDPHSPAVAAAWRAISSPGGMLCNAQAEPRTKAAAAAGYRVYKWGRRVGLLLRRRVALDLRRQGASSKRSRSAGASGDGVLAAVGAQGHGE